jgi:hypothetical protein
MTNGLDRSIEVQREKVERLRREYEHKKQALELLIQKKSEEEQRQ